MLTLSDLERVDPPDPGLAPGEKPCRNAPDCEDAAERSSNPHLNGLCPGCQDHTCESCGAWCETLPEGYCPVCENMENQ